MNMATPTSFTSLLLKTVLPFALLKIANADLSKLKPTGSQNGTQARDVSLGGLFSSVENYGCWCYLPPDADYRSNARGKPVDQMDSICKAMINGYKCATMDAEDNGEISCDAQTVPFNFPNLFIGTPIADLPAQCLTLNPDNICGQRACQVEIAFVLPTLCGTGTCEFNLDANVSIDPSFVHISAGGTFDPETQCTGIFNPVVSETECCGDYPEGRRPFRVSSGFTTRSCCGNTVINHLIQDCCHGETPVEFGSDCEPLNFDCSISGTLINPDENSRSYSSIFGNNAIGTGHAQSMINSPQGWSAAQKRVGQYMIIDLGSNIPVQAMAIQSRHDANQRVTSYQLKYWMSGEIEDNGVFATNENGALTFVVPNDENGVDYNTVEFGESVTARYFQIIVQSWSGHISMRAGVVQCEIV